jgi:hypothetical protein
MNRSINIRFGEDHNLSRSIKCNDRSQSIDTVLWNFDKYQHVIYIEISIAIDELCCI